jgi:hypothetical protein
LAAALAALATATGAFDQMQRNEPQWSAAVFGVAVLSGVLVVAAGGIGSSAWRWVALGPALVAFLFAAVAGIFFLINAHGARPTPYVTASLKTTSPAALTGTVKVDQVTSSETVDVFVGATTDAAPTDATKVTQLFEARMGAAASGSFELPLNVIVPDGFRTVTVRAWVIRQGQQAKQGSACFPDKPNEDTIESEPGCVVIGVPARP